MVKAIFHNLRQYKKYCIILSPKRFKGTFYGTEVKMQVFTQKRNAITGNTEWDVQHEDYDFHQEIARSAFADMLHDTERNKKYYRALQLAIEKMHEDGRKANVLDIGTGTGLLSIMAVRCGADSVIACEAFQPMAECCSKILQRNGVADKITIIPKISTEITVGEDGDMKQKANILVTEVFDTELIGEGALLTFAHAHKHLLEKDCIVVPDSAIMYVQVVESPTLQKWNKLNDLANEDLEIVLRTPMKMKNCPGSAAVHDVQLSQLSRTTFKELSDQVPVFTYDWSGRTNLEMTRTGKQNFTVTNTGRAQMVFMWWELNMDPEGKILLSCAPWWCHPDADMSAERPHETIPWRDHWMQAVYYLPKEVTVKKDSEMTLVSCHDQYSLWFYLEDSDTMKNYDRPDCECGVHMAFSRTHVSYLNDGKRSKKMLAQLKQTVTMDDVVLDLNGSGFLGLAAAKMGAKKIFLLESANLNIDILNDYAKENGISNIRILPDVDEAILKQVTYIMCEPSFSSAVLPWENLKMAYVLDKCRGKLREDVKMIPEGCEFWAMPVEFQDLHKIRIPIGICEGIDMGVFDDLVESSRAISDAEIEPQPLWEYTCFCRGRPRKLLDIDMYNLQEKFATDNTFLIDESQGDAAFTINGFAIWAVWKVAGKPISFGPLEMPMMGQRVFWDEHTRQAVKILKKTYTVTNVQKWSYQLVCDVEKGQFELTVDLQKNGVDSEL